MNAVEGRKRPRARSNCYEEQRGKNGWIGWAANAGAGLRGYANPAAVR
jgi:hypothetical protein